MRILSLFALTALSLNVMSAEIHDVETTTAEMNAQAGIVRFVPGTEPSVGESTDNLLFSGIFPNEVVRLGHSDQQQWTVPALNALDEYLYEIKHRSDTIGSIALFDTDKTEIDNAEVLNKIVKTVKDNPGSPVIIDGYTDNVGGLKEHNWTLSTLRAETVRQELVSRGVPEGDITAKGHGPLHPIAPNDSPEGRAQNRRAQIIVDPSNGIPNEPN